MIHKVYQSSIDVKNRPEYLEKIISSALNPIKTRIDRKNTAIPLLMILVKNAIKSASIIIGINVTIYESIILIIPIEVKEFVLKSNPDIIEKIITNKRLKSTKIIIETNFAVKNLSLVTGLVSDIFIVFCENSPEKLSMVTSAVNKGKIMLSASFIFT